MALKSLFYSLMFNIVVAELLSELTDSTIFEEDYCDVKCAGMVHTMCPIKNPTPQCPDFELHRLDKNEYAEQLEELIIGHNGIRDRIAGRMELSSMLEMAWDRKLAKMAENFLYRCEDRVFDPCTLYPHVFREETAFDEFFQFNISYKYIVQNMFYEESHFYPYKFLERVISKWYLEKDGMRAPTIVEYGPYQTKMKRLLGENNFTHISYPFIYRFGCAIAKFNGGFHIVCNYYPYYRSKTNSLLYESSESDCPARFPLHDIMFKNLCTDYSDGVTLSDNSYDNDTTKLLVSSSFWILLTIGLIAQYSFHF